MKRKKLPSVTSAFPGWFKKYGSWVPLTIPKHSINPGASNAIIYSSSNVLPIAQHMWYKIAGQYNNCQSYSFSIIFRKTKWSNFIVSPGPQKRWKSLPWLPVSWEESSAACFVEKVWFCSLRPAKNLSEPVLVTGEWNTVHHKNQAPARRITFCQKI